MTLKTDLTLLDRLTDGEADNLRTAQRQGDLPETLAFDWYYVEDSLRQMPEDVRARFGDPKALSEALSRVMAVVGGGYEVVATYALPDYEALGQTDDEIALLVAHDKDEVLHPFVALLNGDSPFCKECGDDESGLMHNNTWRNVEPLVQEGDDYDTGLFLGDMPGRPSMDVAEGGNPLPSITYDEATTPAQKEQEALAVSPSGDLDPDEHHDEPVTYTVTISNTFDVHSPSEAVECMVAYLLDYASTAGYRVTQGMTPYGTEPSCFIDAEELSIQ